MQKSALCPYNPATSARGTTANQRMTPISTPQIRLSVIDWPHASSLSSARPAPIARAMIACAPTPSPAIAIPINHPTYDPIPIPSSAGTTVVPGKLPAIILSTRPTHAATSCCNRIGIAKNRIADHIVRPASLPLRIDPSRATSAPSRAITASGGSSGPTDVVVKRKSSRRSLD